MRQKVKIKNLRKNEGQIQGLPTNPRQWTKKEVGGFEKFAEWGLIRP
jgi:hypothetical protein